MNCDILVKFGRQEYMEQLFRHGVVYMDTLRSHRKREKDPERHDPNEGLEEMTFTKNASLKMQDPETGDFRKISTMTDVTARTWDSNLDRINVFCLFHCILPQDREVKLGDMIPERVWKGFGDTAVFIYRPPELISRLQEAAKVQKNRRICSDWVKYENLSCYSGKIGPFKKDLRFAHQKEFRVAVFDPDAKSEPLRISIGSLQDIALMIPADKVHHSTIQPLSAKNR